MAQEILRNTTIEKVDTLVKIHATATVKPLSTTNLTPLAEVGPTFTLPEGVVKVQKHEYRAAAACLADAFSKDHVALYFIDCPDTEHWSESQKWALHVNILEYIVYAHLLNGLVIGVPSATNLPGEEQSFDAVALWMPPGANMDDLPTIIRSGLWRLYYQLSSEGRFRFFSEFFPLLHNSKEEVLGERDPETWYLVYIGTRETARGKGCAKKLIHAVTDKTDKEGRACYLESSNEINLMIYGKLGFELKKVIALERADQPIEMHVMVREPVNGKGL
jgi:GNAT superfamily N-acetyltransferase